MNFLLALGGCGLFFLLLGANFFFFFALALFNFLSRSLTLQRGCRGECQKPLIRLLLSVTRHPLPPSPAHAHTYPPSYPPHPHPPLQAPRSHPFSGLLCQRHGLCFFFFVIRIWRGGGLGKGQMLLSTTKQDKSTKPV